MAPGCKFCELCLDGLVTGDEPVREATHLMHEVYRGEEQYTPICDGHAAAARRYRLAFGISRALPLGAEPHS